MYQIVLSTDTAAHTPTPRAVSPPGEKLMETIGGARSVLAWTQRSLQERGLRVVDCPHFGTHDALMVEKRHSRHYEGRWYESLSYVGCIYIRGEDANEPQAEGDEPSAKDEGQSDEEAPAR